MTDRIPTAARRFATEVIQKLRAAGFHGLLAGGCVRDQLLGVEPKDYDVATNARPDQIRAIFGRRRTLAIGAAFGVITVLGRKPEGQVEVATFRRDAAYSDGRHPDSVTFSTPEEDARRRDFTVNALFFDPLTEQVIDYVGGRDDLQRRVIRAVGHPHERFEEDKLRMLRAVRFAATLDFELEPATLDAIRQRASQILVVSVERIAGELRRMLIHSSRTRAMQLLADSRLLTVILPEAASWQLNTVPPARTTWEQTLSILARLQDPSFPVALAAVLRGLIDDDLGMLESICRRWKLSNEEADAIRWLLQHEPMIRNARRAEWSQLQPILVDHHALPLLQYSDAVAATCDGTTADVEFCRGKLELPRDELNPPPLINGEDLKRLGIAPGPAYRRILHSVRNAQLEGRIGDQPQALELARTLSAAPDV